MTEGETPITDRDAPPPASRAVYFTAPDGIVYRVLDTRTLGGRTLFADPPGPWPTGETTRVFRPRAGRLRFYPLAFLANHPDWSAAPTPAMLAQLFERSELGGRTEEISLRDRAVQAATAQLADEV